MRFNCSSLQFRPFHHCDACACDDVWLGLRCLGLRASGWQHWRVALEAHCWFALEAHCWFALVSPPQLEVLELVGLVVLEPGRGALGSLAGSQAHVMASTYAAVSSMMALHHAARTGQGQRVDVSVEETTASVTHICGVGKWLDDQIIPKRMGTGLFASVPSGAYRCKDGLVYLMVNRPLHWKALAQWISEVTGNDAVLDPLFDGPSSNRFANRDVIDFYITELTTRYTVDEVYHEGQRRHIAVTPVNTAAAVARDPQLAARDYFVDVAQAGRGTLKYPGAPYRHSETPWCLSRPAPRIGEHNEEIYGRELGLPADVVRMLAESGIT